MPQRYSVVIFFNDDRLESNQRLNPAKRRLLLQEGVEMIRAAFPGVRLGTPWVSSLSVSAEVPADLLADLQDFLSTNRLGRSQLDGDYIMAAN